MTGHRHPGAGLRWCYIDHAAVDACIADGGLASPLYAGLDGASKLAVNRRDIEADRVTTAANKLRSNRPFEF